jgi:hypothetical protein
VEDASGRKQHDAVGKLDVIGKKGFPDEHADDTKKAEP